MENSYIEKVGNFSTRNLKSIKNFKEFDFLKTFLACRSFVEDNRVRKCEKGVSSERESALISFKKHRESINFCRNLKA